MLRALAAENSVECLRIYQLIPTFQLLTSGIRRRRRPIGFDFSSYADPAILGETVQQILSCSCSIAPGTYLVGRDGTIETHPEITKIRGL
jgi:hypothetical protein